MTGKGALHRGSRPSWLPLPLGIGALLAAFGWAGAQGPVGAAVVGATSVGLSAAAIVSWVVLRPRRLAGTVGFVLALIACAPVLFVIGLLVMGEG